MPLIAVTLASRASFARLHSVSKTAVSKWEGRGAVVVVDGKISVEASDRLLMHAGLGRFSERARRPKAAPPAPILSTSVDSSRERGQSQIPLPPEVLLPLAVNLLTTYFNRTCAFAGLAAWEHGASLETAQQTDSTFRVLAMEAATGILSELDLDPPAGFRWEDQPIWDADRMAQIDWSAVEPRHE